MKRLSDQTLYEIIEVSAAAAPAEIARACDRAAATYGPGSLATYTLASAEETALLSSRIEEARVVLLDASARSRYDERIGVRPHDAPAPAPAATPLALTPAPVAAAPAPPASTPVPSPPPPPHGAGGRAGQTFTPPPWPPPEVEAVSTEARHSSPGLPVVAPPPPQAAAAPPPAGASPQPHAGPPLASLPPPAPALASGEEASAQPPVAPAPLATRPGGPLPTPAPPVPIALTRAVAPILLENEVAPPRPLLVPDGAAWSGELLRRVRESRGLTVQQVAERTRITRHHLENIEQDRFKALPAPVYLRGIIMSLARELRLDGQKVARSYLDRMGAGTDTEPKR